MPGGYSVVKTDYPEGVVSVKSMNDTPYNEIQNSLGSSMYEAQEAYIKTNNYEQLQLPIQFQKYDANGNIKVFTQTVNIDPNQLQPAIYVDLKNNRLIFDGTLFLTLPLLPLETCFLFLDVKETAITDLVKGPTMFKTSDFFKEFKDKIDYGF